MAGIQVEFRVKCSATKPGEAVFIMGSAGELGAWDTRKGVPCITAAQVFPMWTSAQVRFGANTKKVEFKTVVQKAVPGSPDKAKWEGGNNKLLHLPEGKRTSLVVVYCEHGSESTRIETIARSASRTLFNLPEDEEVDESIAEPPAEMDRQISFRQGFGRRQSSRHLLMNSDGSIDMEMTRTPSLMMIDFQEFEKDAETKAEEMVVLEKQRLNDMQRRLPSGSLLQDMAKVTDYADPSKTVLLQGFNWNSHQGKGTWYGVVESKIDMMKDMGITDIWLPPPSASVAPQGYLPTQLFNINSQYGSQDSLEGLLRKLHDAGIRGVADIVINHRCGDKQDSQGRWNVFTTGMVARPSFAGVMDWQGWAITLGDRFSDGSGQNHPGHYDQKFDAAPNIDHKNEQVQKSISIWLRWLRLQVGFDAWRFDFVKGYGAEFVGHYCRKSEPAWAVGELWADMEYDHDGLRHNQDKNRQDLCNWVNATGKASTAFDFTTKGILQEACRNNQYWRLRDSNGKPPGLIGWMPKWAVTFIDNHDTGSTQNHWPFPGDKVLVGYAYIITHPGIPCIFWDHIMDWGDDHRRRIADLLKARRESGIPVDAPVSIKAAEDDHYLAEIGSPPALRVALGPRHASDPGGDYWRGGPSGNHYRVWVHVEEKKDSSAARKAEEAKKAEEARRAEEARKAAEAQAEAARKAEEARKQEARKADEARKAAEVQKQQEEVTKAASPTAASPFASPSPESPKESLGHTSLIVRIPKHLMGNKIVVCGELPSLGSWNPSVAPEMQLSDGKYILNHVPVGVRAGVLFKYVVMKDGKPKWESGRPDRTWPDLEAAPVTHIFDSMEEESEVAFFQALKLPVNAGQADEIAARIAKEDRERPSYRMKLDLSRKMLVDGHMSSLRELAGLQAYLTFVASGQIKCQEDGRHFRPCAAANTARAVTEVLWSLADQGDAECFISRRIFPSLPSYADHFTCAVPMTRIRDIAHRNDIPKDIKLHIKHNIQNKLHRCADPGDLKVLDELVERVHREGNYSPAFVKELDIFHVELREFFNASGLDDTARQVAGEDGSVKPAVDRFLGLKHGGADAFEQLLALGDLRRALVTRVRAEQTWLRLDLELEKYSFVLLSQVANGLEGGGQGTAGWWQQLVKALQQALVQSELSGISKEECAVVAREFAAVLPELGDASKAPFAPQRAAATADRALRICFGLQQQLEEAYAGVPAIGKALNIEAHAISVFTEAEMRTSVLFQMSKLVELAMKSAKSAAGLPLWTAISAGSTTGIVVRCGALSETWSKELPAKGAIVFCDEAGGDEEIPQRCRGVVVARDLPVLSHLALRARQLGVVFACTAESKLFEQARASVAQGKAARLTSEANGGVRVEAISESEIQERGDAEKPKAKSGPPKVGTLSLADKEVKAAMDLAASPQTAGAKAASSGKLEVLAKEGGFNVPKGVAVPFSIMRESVKGADFEKALTALAAALDSASDKVEACAQALRDAVERCEVPSAVLDALQAGLPKGTARVAVRSSANSEDLEGVSGAGLHDSVLGVDLQDRSALQKAVLQVWSSLFTLRAVQSRYAAGMPLYDGIAMGVLVQPMVSLLGRAYAFIAFSKDVVAGDTGAVYAEVCVGLGETLASANEPGTPYRLVIRKEAPHEVKVLSLASYSFGLQDAAGGPQRTRVDYSSERLSTDLPFLQKVAQDIASVACCVEKGYGLPMDMEGVVLEESSGRQLHLVQARPIVEG